MKIKEICEKTGLTDRTVRYYIEEGLISPFYTENYLGRKAFDFSEQDLDRLKSIATLRSFGFTVEEIKALSLGDADSKQIVDAVKQRASESLDESQRRIHVLRELDLSSEGDLLELSRKLYDRDMAIRNENVRPDPKKRILSFLRSCAIFLAVWLPILLAGIVLVVKIAVLDMPIVRPVFLFCTVLCFLPSLFIALILKKTNETKKAHRILTLLCLVCLPLSIFFSYKSITVCEHNYDTYRTIVAATCSREGEAVLTCKECGGFSVKKVQKLPHQTVVTKGYAPTCSRAGLSDGSYCSVCRETLVAHIVIAATNDHTPVIDAAVPATCKSTGLTEGSHCSVCNKVFIAQTVLPATQHHTIVIDKAVDATCAAAGLSEGSHCSVCKKTIVQQAILERLPHEYENRLCKNCGDLKGSEGLEFTKIDGGYALSGIGTCRDEIIYIPSSYNGLPVTEITRGSLSFSFEGYSPREIVIPDSVQHVRWGAMGFDKFVRLRVGKNAVFESNSIGNSGGIEIMYSATSVIPSDAYNGGDDTAPCVVRQTNESRCITTEDGFVFIRSGSTYFLCDYIGTAEDITLPEHCNGKPYVITDYCFYKNKVISSVKIGNGVSKIGYHAFYESSVKHLDLSGQFTVLPGWCFMKCTQLESVVIPDNVELIEVQCFDQTSLRTVTIGKNVKKVMHSVFGDHPDLDTLYFNAVDCTTVSSGCFNGFKKVVIGASVTTIPNNFMKRNDKLESIVFEENSSCTSIGTAAFSKTPITEIALPKSLTHLYGAFSDCTKLEKIYFSCENLTNVANGAFNDCGSDGNGIVVTVASNVTVLPAGLLKNCNINELVFESGSQCKVIQPSFTSGARFPKSILPASVESFEISAFNLKNFSIEQGNEYFVVENDCVIDLKESKLLGVCSDAYIIPEYVTAIAKNAFSQGNVTHIYIPDTVLTMEKGCLACDWVQSVSLPFIGTDRNTPVMLIELFSSDPQYGWIAVDTLPGSGQSKRYYVPPKFSELTVRGSSISIGLRHLSMLKEIKIAKTVETVSSYALKDCPNLTSICFEGTAEQWNALKASGWLANVSMNVNLTLNADIDS